jgi:hypothetical protein
MPVSHTRRMVHTYGALAIIFTMAGCTSVTKNLQTANDALPWNAAAAKTRKLDSTAVRIAAVWTHDIVSVPGSNPVQGFGGRIYFYNYEQKAIPVEGELVVFAFDDTNANQQNLQNRKPDRKFVFRADQLQTHLSDSELGPSYSFWIPWQVFGGEQRLINLVPVFMPVEGGNVTGHFSKTSLPGKHKPIPSAQPHDQFAAPPQTYQKPQSQTISREQSPNNLASTVQTTTFAVPQNLTRHLVSSTTMPANHTSVAPKLIQANSSPTVSATEQPQHLEHNRQPYRSLTSPSGLQAIKIIPPATR